MARGIQETPFLNDAASVFTSGPIPLWDCYDWSISFRTTFASFSTVTVQLSNATSDAAGSIPEAAWSTWTLLGNVALSGTTFRTAPHAASYVRFVRSNVSNVIETLRIPNY